MKIYKAYKFRLYPNKIQQHLINKTLGCTRFIYNTMLYERE
ncbi:MAG TPA: helix-turn-helix domain-containing protein, partial [Candidatus Faecisoma merdavium]|nr:helix-turn-helix domain-containing protein [Candidatus Faecisoma merdavium]HIS90342.1 helix-turn-helix domain-containing protein [Candidatus Faecisoma merdavium]